MSDKKETLVVASKTKAYVKGKGFMVSSDALDALNEKVHGLLDNALDRTKQNKRSTLRPYDL